MSRCTTLLAAALLGLLAFAGSAQAAEAPCELEPRVKCFGLESLEAALSTTQAGAHPDLTFTFGVKQDPESKTNSAGFKNSYAPLRNTRIELPPGLIGDPNVLGISQLCTTKEISELECPRGAQIGVVEVYGYLTSGILKEPLFMMPPPGGESVARLGFSPGQGAIYIEVTLRSEGDYGLTFDAINAPLISPVVRLETTTWGIPADKSHNTERCTQKEASSGCKSTPPTTSTGGREVAFLTNPTRCGVPLEMRVGVASWAEPERFDTKSASFPEITGCNRLPFGPRLTLEPTNHRAGAPTGLDVTVRAPASDGVEVLEPAQIRDVVVQLPKGLALNPGSADGLDVCDDAQVHYGKRVAAECPDAAKLAEFEADIAALPRRIKGAVYLRAPEPGNPFRAWFVADDLGAHVKLPGQLNVDRQTGQIESVLLDTPQAPIREAKFVFKSGFRAPLVNPSVCDKYTSHFEFTPWSGGPPVAATSPMQITEGCDTGGFAPRLSAGSTDPTAGQHSPFAFTLTRQDGEQNPAAFQVTLPRGFAATFAGIPRCEGSAAQSGACPSASRIGKVIAAVGAGPAPLWVPQPGKRPSVIYLGGPYMGAPTSIVAVVPRQAGPFDFGDEIIRTPVFVDPVTAQATARTDALPQLVEGIPIRYRTIDVELDRPGFALNPTSCEAKQTAATLTSSEGATATATSPFAATNCVKLPLKPKLSFRLRGGTHRGAHPRLQATLKERKGDANLAGVSVALPHSEFLDQAHIGTVCTRVQFAAHQCPTASIYGRATVKTPLFDETFSGPVYLRSSSHPLPDLVIALKGPDSIPLEIVAAGRVDSVNGGIRTNFDFLPDAPVSSFTLNMQGGKKGILVNSTNLCEGTHKATAEFTGHNGRELTLRPELVAASCAGRSKRR